MSQIRTPPRVVSHDIEVVGGWDHDIRVFRGIPFAAPPVGDLRWRPPQPLERKGLVNADGFASDPVQAPLNPGFQGTRAPGNSEDCLYLNVWAPAGAEGLPVMVWIFGGGFVGGSASNVTYDGRRLAERGVVLVTISYRLGVFGFLAHPELTAESPHGASGNYGLMDQCAALAWVRTHIGAFGGDPANVTVFGESAGATSTSYLMTSPQADELFDKAILQSPGAMRGLLSLSEAEARGEALGTLADLRAMGADQLLALNDRYASGFRSVTAPRPLGPIADGWLLIREDWEAYASGAVRPRPLLLGCNGDEGEIAARHRPFRTVAAYLAYVRAGFGAHAEEALSHYGAATASGVLRALSDLFGDTQFVFGARRVARAMTALGGPTYLYWFTPGRAGQAAAPTHGEELPYVFGTLEQPFDGQETPFNAKDAELSEFMMDCWTTFARTGRPTADDTSWPAYEESSDRALILDHERPAASFPRKLALDFLERVRAEELAVRASVSRH